MKKAKSQIYTDDRNSKQPASEDLYHRMISEVRDYAIILLDPHGYVTDWNKGAEEIKGYSADEIIGKRFDILFTEGDVNDGLPDHLLNLAKMQGSISHEGWRVRKDGLRFWSSAVITALNDEDGKLIGFTKVTRDLTESKKAEDKLQNYAHELAVKNEELAAINEELQAANEDLAGANEELRQSEERYHRMVAEVQDYAIILLNSDGDIEDWNAGAEAIKGYKASEIIGKNFKIFYTPEDRERGLPESLINLARHEGRAHHEGWRVRKNGSKFWGSVTITALHGHQNDVIGFTKVTRDRTDLKIAEDNLKRKNAELEEINKELAAMNKELSSFAYISSHDLQEPLRKIQTFSTRIVELDEKNLTPKGLEYFNRIIAAAQRMRLLIDDLLTYSRTNTVDRNYERVDLNKVIGDVLADLENIVEEKNIIVESGPLPVVNVISFQFYQLFSNLITNAIKFARQDTVPYILIRSGAIPAGKVPGLQKRVADTYQHITVADNGIGFSPEYNNKIFEVFQRLHGRDEYAGTGIGLSICKKIVENHDGVIRAEGKPGEGATFHIYIPAIS